MTPRNQRKQPVVQSNFAVPNGIIVVALLAHKFL
jgi:hypothetical protein